MVAQAAEMELHHESVVEAHAGELVEHVRLEAPGLSPVTVPRERIGEDRRAASARERRGVGARRGVVGRRCAEHLERSPALAQRFEERA